MGKLEKVGYCEEERACGAAVNLLVTIFVSKNTAAEKQLITDSGVIHNLAFPILPAPFQQYASAAAPTPGSCEEEPAQPRGSWEGLFHLYPRAHPGAGTCEARARVSQVAGCSPHHTQTHTFPWLCIYIRNPVRPSRMFQRSVARGSHLVRI